MSSPAVTEREVIASSPVKTLVLASFQPIDVTQANACLVAWKHRLGEVRRPFGVQAFGLFVQDELVSVAVSASIVSTTVAGYRRNQVVELARLCSAPHAAWTTRLTLRLWREIGARCWPYWPVLAAVSYSQNQHHRGDIYRFDGWERVAVTRSTKGGGTWTRRRSVDHPALGSKTLWIWRFSNPDGADP